MQMRRGYVLMKREHDDNKSELRLDTNSALKLKYSQMVA